MTASLSGRTIAFLATDGVEQVELTEPWAAVERAGGRPELIGLKPGEIQGVNHDEKGDSFVVDKSVGEAAAGRYDGLVLPGGTRNPDRLRMDKDAVGFVSSFFDAGKPVAVICHGPWTLVEADVVRGRTITSGRPCRPTCATQAPTGSTRRSSSTATWCPAGNPTTYRRSRTSWWR